MSTLRTLVVDDELGMRLSIRKALSKFTLTLPHVDESIEFDVDIAETGEEALEKIARLRPDILLLDYKLPDASGLDILEKVSTEDNEMVTIMITAFASIETAVTAIKRGAFDFLPKPFTPEELKKNVAKAAERLILARHVKKLAEEKKKVRFQFISVLGHELKSPLNSIDGYLDIMNKQKLGADISDYAHLIDRCTIRLDGMRKLILDLLDLTRIESGEKKRELKECDVRVIAETAIETALPMAMLKGVKIHLHCDGDFMMQGDNGELEIVFNNLLSNAVKYNKENGSVDISLKRDDKKIVIDVADTGIGMTQVEADKLFNEFVRIKNEKTKNILGSGLGLTILKRIAQMYNGDVSVKSVPDEGSTFTVTLMSE
ncbi:hybrid sensor histidine kinase/response regulator [candidate division KSB1 bacterium]|nr:hybrid sensor histidine kinase/response regulator [candidate division KSB1 bacterium]